VLFGVRDYEPAQRFPVGGNGLESVRHRKDQLLECFSSRDPVFLQPLFPLEVPYRVIGRRSEIPIDGYVESVQAKSFLHQFHFPTFAALLEALVIYQVIHGYLLQRFFFIVLLMTL
jgi:hypothetical protein